MALLLHVTGDGREPLSPFAGHLVRNLERARFSAEAVDAGVDAVVVSSASPEEAVAVVDEVRRADREQPVVLVSDGSPGWGSVAVAFPGVQVVQQDPHALAEALAGLGIGPEATGSPASGPEEHGKDPAVIDLRPPVPRGGSRSLLRERLGENARLLGSSTRGFGGLASQAEAVPQAPELVEAPAPLPEARPLRDPGSDEAARPAPEPSRKAQSRRRARASDAPDVLVPALLGVTDRLYGVRETGSALAAHVQESVGVDAVAVLVPDGRVWVVAGATGHRHLEERLVLGHDHWLVQEVGQAHHGVVVEDTDVVRTRLAGAPLAAWPYLMACPVASLGIVLMARSDGAPPFSSRDLSRASEALVEAELLLRSALDVRELARRLLTYAELDDPGFD